MHSSIINDFFPLYSGVAVEESPLQRSGESVALSWVVRRGVIAAADSSFPPATAGQCPWSRRGDVGRYDYA